MHFDLLENMAIAYINTSLLMSGIFVFVWALLTCTCGVEASSWKSLGLWWGLAILS